MPSITRRRIAGVTLNLLLVILVAAAAARFLGRELILTAASPGRDPQ